MLPQDEAISVTFLLSILKWCLDVQMNITCCSFLLDVVSISHWISYTYFYL